MVAPAPVAAKPEDVVLEESGYSKELEEELNRGVGEVADADSDPIGCWSHFTKAISSFWNTTDMQAGEEREVIVRTTLRELAVYLVFLAILCVGK